MKTASEIKYAITNSPYGRGVNPAGKSSSSFMVIKDSPGRIETLTGLSFTDKLGATIRNLIRENNLETSSFYFTNAIKVERRNGEVQKQHYNAYWKPVLNAEISLINPKFVIAIGQISGTIAGTDKRTVIRIGHPAKVRELDKAIRTIKAYLDRDKTHWVRGENGHIE